MRAAARCAALDRDRDRDGDGDGDGDASVCVTTAAVSSACSSTSGVHCAALVQSSGIGAPPLKKKKHNSKQKARPRLRLADPDVAALVSKRTTSQAFVSACDRLESKDQIKILAGTDLQVWNLALQNRLIQDDVDGARALLSLIGNFDVENTNEQLWTDLLFTLMRQQSTLSDGNEVKRILDELHAKYGHAFVADLVVSVVNGCANIKMFDQAQFLVLYHLALGPTAQPIPSRIVGNLVSVMAAKHRYTDVIAFTADLFKHPAYPLEHFQQQGFIALFRSHAAANEPPNRAIASFLRWFDATYKRLANGGDAMARIRAQHFEKVFGAAIQCCIETESPKLALRCYDALRQLDSSSGSIEDESGQHQDARSTIPMDENMYVNVMKACVAQSDAALFKDVYRAMVSDSVARSPGFGSAIRFCNNMGDARFLEEVLDDAFALEDALQGAWMLAVPQYNDALGCFAATKSFESAKDLFSRMLQNPFIVPDHITMLEIVENHRDAPFSDVFHLMELFLEWDLCPNLQVFTSLLATCARRRLIGDALALLDAMKTQGIEPDVKTYTVIAFVYGTHGDVGGIVRILKTMAQKQIATDELFFEYVLNALHGASGIDICFSLFRELRDVDLSIPEGLYNTLIDIGTTAGLVERTLHIAYNMECDGFTLSSPRMHALIARCESNAEITELLRTFVLLHQGYQDEDTPRFAREVYDELIDALPKFSKKDMIPKIKKLAEEAGHDMA
uniref:Pentacotripeptide-repeat region of PRORP domain-containing protein n=1 Tax=Globisporangium ultimum (strain ATCC 200006 / CBS 805.95 / DAOM BR144) TaxID=431595 RepID=K3X8B9_GLOUD